MAMMAAVGVMATGGAAQAVVLSSAGLSMEVTTTATSLVPPTNGRAPVTLTVEGTIRPTADGSEASLTTVALRLDRRLRVTTVGLGTCSIADVQGEAPAQARKACGDALIGSGSLTRGQFSSVESEPPPLPDLHERLLVFNAGKNGSRMLLYRFLPKTGNGVAAAVATPAPAFQFRFGIGGVVKTFGLDFGRTWRDHGQPRSYLSGPCAGGTLSNRMTFTFLHNTTLSGSVPTSCG